jgi:hypothetical protein
MRQEDELPVWFWPVVGIGAAVPLILICVLVFSKSTPETTIPQQVSPQPSAPQQATPQQVFSKSTPEATIPQQVSPRQATPQQGFPKPSEAEIQNMANDLVRENPGLAQQIQSREDAIDALQRQYGYSDAQIEAAIKHYVTTTGRWDYSAQDIHRILRR